MTGSGGGAAGIDPERVAELIVTTKGPGPDRRGSGYRITAKAVLTAAHVVRDEAGMRVRFDADRTGEWVADGRVTWSDPEIDVAVVAIDPRPGHDTQVEPVGFGRVAERDAVLSCSVMGFPLFKLRDDPPPSGGGPSSKYRDSAHAVGTIAVLSNRREGTLEVSVPAPERDPDPAVSPWGGMSGAAVWSAGSVVGLVAEHHRTDGLGRLAATRVDRWYERLSPSRLGQLRRLTGLPATAEELRETVPPRESELVEAGYHAQVRDIAPEELRGREQELEELIRFCAGDERYQWWRAKAWAGKSALAAWFVLHPPAGVRVVSFFVTRRLAGQADSNAFTEAMVEQLAAVADEPTMQATTPAGWDRERSRLLDLAARKVGERDGRLLLVVDGLDEDEGARPASGKPSIASLLPRRPAENVRVLVTSRPHPGIPLDVPGGHPLRRCVPRLLDPSPFAHDIEVAAMNELTEQLHGDELQVHILGLVAASGGGLTVADLAELTGSLEWALGDKLGTVFGRSLMARAQRGPLPAGPDDVVYLFAHETLGTTAEQKLGDEIGRYREQIDRWADGYRASGWPATTPQYLLRPYGQLLADKGELRRLAELGTDPARHDRLLATTLGDGDAITEVVAAQKLALDQPVPDLGTLGRLAVHHDRLAGRNENLPVELPGLLVRLEQRRRGEAIAKSMRQPQALAAVAGALADAGRWDRAERTAREIADTGWKARALATIGSAMAGTDRERALDLLEEAERAAHDVREAHLQPFVLAAVAEAFADAGLWERAERTAHAIDPMYAAAGARALRAVVDAVAAAGHWDRAERTANAIHSVWDKAAAMAALAGAMTGHDQDRALGLVRHAEGLARGHLPLSGDPEPLSAIIQALNVISPERALRLAADAEQATRRVPFPAAEAHASGRVAQALAMAGLWDGADRVAQRITEDSVQADLRRSLSATLAQAGHGARAAEEARGIPDPRVRAEAMTTVARILVTAEPERALGLVADAEQTARAIPHAGRFWALQAVARARAAAGQLELAERAARHLMHPDLALGSVARAQAAAGQWDNAERTALRITDPEGQVTALVAVARAMTDAGQWDRAERTVGMLVGRDPVAHAEATGALAEAIAGSDPARAAALAAGAAQVTDAITDPRERDKAALAVARALAAAGLADRAGQTARAITDPKLQIEALGSVARALLRVDRPRALALAAEAERQAHPVLAVSGPLAQAQGLSQLAEVLSPLDRERAAALAAEAEQAANRTAVYERADALAAVAAAHAAVAQWDHAERAARRIPSAGTEAEALAALVQALIGAVEWDRAQRVAAAIPDPEAQVRAQAALAGALATADPDRALDVASAAEDTTRAMTNQYNQEQAWAVLASTLTAATTPDPAAGDRLRQRARHLVAEVLATGRWLDALEPLGQLDPEALAAVDQELNA